MLGLPSIYHQCHAALCAAVAALIAYCRTSQSDSAGGPLRAAATADDAGL
jgi:hypothetical protein